MDIARPDLRRRKQRRSLALGAAAVLLAAASVAWVARLQPAAPEVDRDTILTGTVKLGPLVRQVRGPGTLVPREDGIRLVPAETEATVVKINVLPGAKVEPNTPLMELVDPELEQQLLDAKLAVHAAEADSANEHARLQSELMNQRAAAATVEADQRQASLQARTDKSLYDLGVISGLAYEASKGKAEEMETRNGLEHQRLNVNQQAMATQMATVQAKLDQAKALLALRERQGAALVVRAGIAGVLVDLPHQVGEHVAPGTTLAKVVQPDQLKAQLKIAETQARDISPGEPAEIDTHNGVVEGRVTRVDPAVHEGTVAVDVALDGALPPGARPDLSVDGTIDLERMRDVLSVERPAMGNENSTLSLFKVAPDGSTAVRVPVGVGRASVSSMQVLSGLKLGDTVILSDMSRWDGSDRIRLK